MNWYKDQEPQFKPLYRTQIEKDTYFLLHQVRDHYQEQMDKITRGEISEEELLLVQEKLKKLLTGGRNIE